MLCRGSNESGVYLRREDENERPPNCKSRSTFKLRERGGRLVVRGIRRYVRLRTGWRFRRRTAYLYSQTRNTDMEDVSNYYPSRFRHLPPPDLLDHLPTLPLQTPDFELWINELWHDFLIEPTPYLVASAITYLGFILLVGQYWEIMWKVVCFVFGLFVPWDDESGFEYP